MVRIIIRSCAQSGYNIKTVNIEIYVREIDNDFQTGHAQEHAYRPALKQLMNSIDGVQAINDPKRSAHGNPDFVLLSDKDKDVILGYAETKDIAVNLNKVESSEQMRRYAGYDNLYLTNYIEFRFFKNGEKYQTIEIAKIVNGQLQRIPENFDRLFNELKAFAEQKPEKIRSGKRLAQIMGGKARRIRDNAILFIQKDDDERNQELERIYSMMKATLVHDLSENDFANMYAQTLVYGLFIARYNDKTPDDFTRQEARDLVPKSNPFLQRFFDHIAGSDFDNRLAYIVEELCNVFKVSDVKKLVYEHLKTLEQSAGDKDPILYFYEDFLEEYDPVLRKQMGAYYTPVPIVRFIIERVDAILKDDFGIKQGLADASKHHIDGNQEALHRVQILDPAVGTATFLNEIVKYVYQSFKGQEGRWPSYVEEDLIPRLHGFELMMAPYTIAHLKLSITFRRTGAKDLSKRLGVYLTNTLEEGVPFQSDIFSLGLANAVSEESKEAAKIKNEQPIMVIIGNPPYKAESSNKTVYANSLVDKYRFEPGGTQKLNEKNPKWLGDDYVKFISFAESQIQNTGQGVVAMITNNGFLDNPTFRGMRWHLQQTFNKLYILDLHGSAKKRETTPIGGKDENVFDIQQGVSIMLAVKTGSSDKCKVYHADLYGTRLSKFIALEKNKVNFLQLKTDSRFFYLVPRNTEGQEDYEEGILVNELMPVNNVGVVTSGDSVLIGFTCSELLEQLEKAKESPQKQKTYERLKGHDIDKALVQRIRYRPFDERYIYYHDNIVERPRRRVMGNFIGLNNLGFIFKIGNTEESSAPISVTDSMIEFRSWSRPGARGGDYIAPLYIYHSDQAKSENFSPELLSKLTANLKNKPSPESVFNYIYALLHSPGYREKYSVFLKTEFPRVAIPPNQQVFDDLSILGANLKRLHLMEDIMGNHQITTFPIAGNNKVTRKITTASPGWDFDSNGKGKVWINDEQYFGDIPKVAWEFYVGGYQPAQKWLKDRIDRKLTSSDIEHYQKIIYVLVETNILIQKADRIWKI